MYFKKKYELWKGMYSVCLLQQLHGCLVCLIMVKSKKENRKKKIEKSKPSVPDQQVTHPLRQNNYFCC